MALRAYNDNTLTIPANGADCVIIKPFGCPPQKFESKKDQNFLIDTTGWAPGMCFAQLQSNDGKVLGMLRIEIIQNLATAPEDFDPRSAAEITLDAIDAMLAGRATAQQRRVQLGDKSIEYSTFAELMQWRSHFQKEVRKERGEAEYVKRQIFDMGK